MSQVQTNNIFQKRITLVTKPDMGFNGYKNATGSPTYIKAQADYDAARRKTILALAALDELRTYFKGFEAPIGDGDYNAAIDFVLGTEGYGDAFYNDTRRNTYKKWILPHQMRQGSQKCQGLSGPDWDYAYNAGRLTSYPDIRQCQIDIIKQWLSELKTVETRLKGDYDSAVASEAIAKLNLDKAVDNENKISQQRILENQSDPRYIKAKQDYDIAVLDAARKSKRNMYIFIGGTLFVLVVGGVLLFTSSKKA